MSPPAMTATSTTESRMRDRRSNTVPLLLSSFPAPPSHIPVSPSSQPATSPATNPPLSLPPSAPLPPVPGPSPITEQDTLMFISAARSRRTSKLSLASTRSSYSQRNSTATIATMGSNASGSSSVPSLSPSPSITPLESSTSTSTSIHSLSIPVMSRYTDRSPRIAPRIREQEEPADMTRMHLDELRRPSPMLVPDLGPSDDEKVLDPSLSFRRHRSTGNDSISSIDMRDLPPLREDELEAPPLSAPPAIAPRSSHARRTNSQSSNKNKELPPVPRAGAESPDISTILASTPRPRRKSAGSAVSRSQSRSRAALRRHVSEGLGSRRTSSRSFCSSGTASGRAGSPLELAYAQDAMAATEPWNDESFVEDYGMPLDKTGTPLDIFDRDEEDRLERELEGDGSDSDSSLDIHTPLPNLMLRDGLLSPNSKLLPHVSRTVSPQPSIVSDRPGSLLSMASTVGSIMTKSGIFKDQRDTERRRTRHRDGKLLKGGIGLTTGLGWSDSEDEGAPSPLTRKLSSHTLARKSLPSSLRSSSHPLSRAFSDMTLDSSWMGDPYASKQTVTQGRSSLPSAPSPRRVPASAERRNASSLGVQSRASLSSVRSSSSLRSSSSTRFVAAPLSHINEREESYVDSASSASSASLQTPLTSAGLDDVYMRSTPSSFAPSLRRIHSDLQVHHTQELDSRKGPRKLMPTSPPSAMRAIAPRPLRLPKDQSSLRVQPDGAHRPLIPSSNRSSSGSSTGGDLRMHGGLHRALTRSLHAPDAAQSDALAPPSSPLHSPLSSPIPTTPTRPGMPAHAVKRPRTGTGMTYRSTSNQGLRPSLMRKPSSTALKTSAAVDVVI